MNRMVDESPSSAFVVEMKAALRKRLEASDDLQRRADAQREMEGIMRRYLGRSAWDAMRDAETTGGDMPRGDATDRKTLACGRDRE